MTAAKHAVRTIKATTVWHVYLERKTVYSVKLTVIGKAQCSDMSSVEGANAYKAYCCAETSCILWLEQQHVGKRRAMQASGTPDVGILILVPHVLVLFLPVHQQCLHLVHNASHAIGDLDNAAHGGVFICRDDMKETWQSCWLWLSTCLHHSQADICLTCTGAAFRSLMLEHIHICLRLNGDG